MLDVAIVGFGPVGQVLAALLGQAGHRVAAFERFEEPYALPRAAHIDHEVMRILQGVGAADPLAGDLVPLRDYRWFGADGQPIMTLRSPAPALSGWEPDYLFFQPTLDRELERSARAHRGVTVERGWTAEGLDVGPDGATLELTSTAGDGARRTVRAKWVVGADGANSFVRESLGIPGRDLGFSERWFVVDVEPRDMKALDLPPACQWCDPARPTTHIQSGPRHRRWEFMLLDGEDPDDFGEERAWELLAPWFAPGDGLLTRHTVYEFRSLVADRMRDGRALIVGDAAHLTPPFLGQGLCAGLRDAANVAWKLDLVLRGGAADDLLDTVEAERRPQNEWIINLAVQLGRVVCERDPARAAERDATLRTSGPPAQIEVAPIGAGVMREPDADAPDPLAGRLAVQPRVSGDGREGLLDDIAGSGFTLIARGGDPLAELGDEHLTALGELETIVVSLDPGVPGGLIDLDGTATRWLDEHGAYAALVRPDFYVFGSAATPGDLPALVEDLRNQLSPVLTTT